MDSVTDEFSLARDKLAKDIIGEIVLSENSEKVIKKWRSIFKISQKKLANELSITPSVVSDYESGRRKSPGIKVIKKYIGALMKIDVERGGHVIRSFAKTDNMQPIISNAIVDIKEFSAGIPGTEFCRFINAVPIVKANLEQTVYGYPESDNRAFLHRACKAVWDNHTAGPCIHPGFHWKDPDGCHKTDEPEACACSSAWPGCC
jgi:predicted transcriptional regulator